ncbi:MAG: integral rane protein [Dehalococcoidales bacterium]|nr:integral rane protein [Dehalococcoidales bacterium]
MLNKPIGFKWWLFISVFLFAAGLVLGLTTPVGTADLLPEDMAAIEKMVDFVRPLPPASLFLFILAKNVAAILISFILSPILCLVPVMALTLNGWLLGWVAPGVIAEKSVGYLLAGLLPHGIIELPALIIGEAAALSFGAAVIVSLVKKDRAKRPLASLMPNLKYLALAMALLLPAALIEAYITPILLR